MKTSRILFAALCMAFGSVAVAQNGRTFNKETLLYEGESKHLSNIRQLTFGGDNAEAYFSFDGKQFTFQATNPAWGDGCDQIYRHELSGPSMKDVKPQLISTGKGRTTCSYFMPGDTTILYASTHLADEKCPPLPEKRTDGKYVWAIYPGFDIFVADLKGNIKKQLTNTPGYDAEGTVSPDGKMIVFTSTRSGDLELYTMNIDGSDVRQVTNELGYDGGAFFTPDSKHLIFRASRPKTPEEVKDYKDLLAQNLVTPVHMELYTCDVDGKNMHKITDLPHASWAPFCSHDGKKVIFSSNYKATRGIPFNLFMVNIDGSSTEPEQITFDEMFDAFPMFSPDGKHLIFSSNRNNNGTHETNLFIADWKD